MKKQPTPEPFRSSANRRTSLQGLAGGVAVLPALSEIGRAGSTEELIRVSRGFTPSDQVDESYWRLVKEQFTIKPNLILLNAANLCPSPHLVREKVFRLTE